MLPLDHRSIFHRKQCHGIFCNPAEATLGHRVARVGKWESRDRDPLLALIAVDSRECVIAGRPCSYYNNNPIANECMYIALATIFEVNHSILCDRCAHFVPSTTTATTTPFNSHEQQFNATREIALYYVEQRAK